MVCILISSMMLAAEDPLNSNSPRNQVRGATCLFQDTVRQMKALMKKRTN